MAASLSTAFVTLFETEVKQAYQAAGMLVPKGAVRYRRATGSDTVKFPKLGAGVASVRVPQTDVVPMNLTWSQATCSLTDYNAAEYSDIFNQSHVNFEERRELAQSIAMALGRRQDQIIIDILDAATITSTVSDNIGGSDTNLNVDKLRDTARLLNTDNVPPSDRHILVHANNLAAFLNETEAGSVDYNSVKALVTGDIDTFMGFKFHVIGDRSEGGLPLSSVNRTTWAWHKMSIGYAESLGPKIEINYVPVKTSWLVNGMLSAGAVVIEEAGIVELDLNETTN